MVVPEFPALTYCNLTGPAHLYLKRRLFALQDVALLAKMLRNREVGLDDAHIMALIYIHPNTTFCEGTPEDWREFERLKNKVINDPGFKDKLMSQEHHENQLIKKWRSMGQKYTGVG